MSLRYTISLHRIGEQFSRQTRSQDRVGDHLDWFFQTAQHRDAPLTTLATDLSEVRYPPVQATRLPDHRSRYLDFAGEISGQRGVVQPLVTGFWQSISSDSQRFRFRLRSAAVVLSDDRATPPDLVLEMRTKLMNSLAPRLGCVISVEILCGPQCEETPEI